MRLAQAGCRVRLSEAAPQAGGRCRSFHDRALGLTLDNGNHLILSGNSAALGYLGTIGATDRLSGPADARIPWVDLSDGRRWAVRPNAGPLPWWVLVPGRRVPGTRAAEYLALARLARARPGARVTDVLPPHGPLWERLVAPLMISALNTPPAEASARLAGAIISGTLARGAAACRPLVATPTLEAAFVAPALAWLAARGADVRLGRRLRAVEMAGGRATGLRFADGEDRLEPGDAVVLALPATLAAELIPGLRVPERHVSILNAHFAVAPPAGAEPLTGVVGGTAEWVFAHADRISLTVSAADRFLGAEPGPLIDRLWRETCAVLRLPQGPVPPARLIHEKRATFAATPEEDARRPGPATHLANLVLAGDWTQTGLPATIEGAIASGVAAATLLNQRGAA